MHSVPVPINVRCYSNSDIIVRRSEVTLRAMYGRCPRCKSKSGISAKRSGAAMYTAYRRLEDYLGRDAAAVAAGPDVIR
jgi:hypothetical protein